MGGAQREVQSQLNKNHSSHIHIFLLRLQSFTSYSCYTKPHSASCNKKLHSPGHHSPYSFYKHQSSDGSAFPFNAAKGTETLCVALRWSLCPLPLHCYFHRPPALCVMLSIPFEVGHTSCRVLSTLQIQQNKHGDVVDGKKWFSEAHGSRAKYKYGLLNWWGPSPRRHSSSVAWGFKNTQQIGPTEKKAAKQSHMNPRKHLDNYWLPYMYIFMGFSPLIPSQHVLCNQPEILF